MRQATHEKNRQETILKTEATIKRVENESMPFISVKVKKGMNKNDKEKQGEGHHALLCSWL